MNTRTIIAFVVLIAAGVFYHATLLDTVCKYAPKTTMDSLKGDWDLIQAIIPMDSKFVQNLLPQGLRLKEHTFSPEGTHPVFYIAGLQTNVRSNPPASTVPPYLEVAITIPWVYRENDPAQTPYYTSVQLWLNETDAVKVGYEYWGYPKALTEMWVKDTTFGVGSGQDWKWVFNYTQKAPFNPFMDQISFLMDYITMASTQAIQWYPGDGPTQWLCFTFAFIPTGLAPVDIQVSEAAGKYMIGGTQKAPAFTESQLAKGMRIQGSWDLLTPLAYC